MDGESTCLKRFCLAFIIIYGVLGAIILAFGIIAEVELHDKHDVQTSAGASLFCISGAITMGLSLLGGYGTCKEKKWPLRLYSAFLLLGAIGLTRTLVAAQSLPSPMEKQTSLYAQDDKFKKAVEKLQVVYECCGLSGYEDWGTAVPDSCKCKSDKWERASKCQSVQIGVSTIEVYKESCGHIILKTMQTSIGIVIGMGLTLLVIKVISGLLSMVFCHRIQNPAVTSNDAVPLPVCSQFDA